MHSILLFNVEFLETLEKANHKLLFTTMEARAILFRSGGSSEINEVAQGFVRARKDPLWHFVYW